MDNKTTQDEGKKPDTSAGNAGNASATASETSAKIAELEARLAKETKDKEIYRAGLLAAKDLTKKTKRVTQEDLESPEKLDEVIDAKIQERDLEKKAVQDAEAEVIEKEKLRAENEELRRALEAGKSAGGFGGTAGVGSGHNERSESKPQGYWSEAQKNELRQIYNSRGMYTSDQVEKMLVKAEEIAQNKTAQSARPNDMTKVRSY
jgi:hypothetical protein